jgi:hypothetical protein
MSTTISVNDIKYDLLKIIEPYDGLLERGKSKPVYHLFVTYLNDMRKEGTIREFNVSSSARESATTFDVSIKVSADRTPKKLKIHVGVFKAPYIRK